MVLGHLLPTLTIFLDLPSGIHSSEFLYQNCPDIASEACISPLPAPILLAAPRAKRGQETPYNVEQSQVWNARR